MTISTVKATNYVPATIFDVLETQPLGQEILSYINIVGIVRFEKVCSKFRQITDDNVWKMAFTRDFGSREAQKVSQNMVPFKEAYRFHHCEVKEAFQRVPNGAFILSGEESDTGMKLYGLFSQRFLNQRIRLASRDFLLKLFGLCVNFPRSGYFVRLIIDCFRSSNIAWNAKDVQKVLERSLRYAASIGNLEYIENLLSYENLRELNWGEALKDIVISAVDNKKGYDSSAYDVIKYILELPKFNQVCTGEIFGEIFSYASTKGNNKALTLIMAHPNYSGITIDSYYQAFSSARDVITLKQIRSDFVNFSKLAPGYIINTIVNSKMSYCQEMLLDHPNFPIAYLGQIYCMAICNHNLKLSNLIGKSKKLDYVAGDVKYGIGHALIDAIATDNPAVLGQLFRSGRLSKISLDGEFGLKRAFHEAVEKYCADPEKFGDYFVMGFCGLFRSLVLIDLGEQDGFKATLLMLQGKNPRLAQQFMQQVNLPTEESSLPETPPLSMQEDDTQVQPPDSKRRRTS